MLEKMLALQNKRKKEGGFTLVELIVVLVILAILAALLIPALTGYIDKAKQKNVTAETRQVVMAAQTLYDEAYGKSSTAPSFDSTNKADIKYDDVKSLAEVKGTINDIEVSATTHQISKVEYTNGGKTCTYENGSYTP